MCSFIVLQNLSEVKHLVLSIYSWFRVLRNLEQNATLFSPFFYHFFLQIFLLVVLVLFFVFGFCGCREMHSADELLPLCTVCVRNHFVVCLLIFIESW